MIDKTLRSIAYNEYKKHRLSSWILSFVLILTVIGLYLLSFVLGGVFIIVAPLVVLPLIFATYYSHLRFSLDEELTFRNFFKYFITFYRIPFNGTFRYWTSVLKYFLCFLVMEILFSGVACIVCVSIEPVLFLKMIEIIYQASSSIIYIENPADLFGDTYSLYIIFNNIVNVPSTLISGIFIVYQLSLNSLSFYLRLKLQQANNQFIDLVYKDAIKSNNRTIIKNFINLEWPLFALFALGITTGTLVTLIFSINAEYLILNGFIIGIMFLLFFIPFHFVNLETLYKKYEFTFLTSINKVTSNIFNRYKQKEYKEEKNDEQSDDNKKPS